MFARLFDVVLIAKSRGRSPIGVNEDALKMVDEAYKEVIEQCRDGECRNRPVLVFLNKIRDILTEYEFESSVHVIEDVVDGDRVRVGRGYPWKKYVFPKYPTEGEPIDLRELLAVCPFLGTAKRVVRYQGSQGGV